MQIRRHEEHNESLPQWKKKGKRGTKQEYTTSLISTRKNTPQKKSHRKIKLYSWNILPIYFIESQTAALNKNKHTTSLRKGQTVSDHLVTPSGHHIHIWYWFYTLWPVTYRVYWKECVVLHKNVSQFKLNLYNQRHLYKFLVARVHLARPFFVICQNKPTSM